MGEASTVNGSLTRHVLIIIIIIMVSVIVIIVMY